MAQTRMLTLENCTHVQALICSFPMQSANVTQSVLSFITLISIGYSIYAANKPEPRTRRIQPYKIQSSLWITLLTALVFYTLLSCLTIMLKVYRFWEFTFDSEPCNFMWEKHLCMMVKFPFTASILGYNTIVVVLLVERIIATFCTQCYSRYSRLLGVGLVVLMVTSIFNILNYCLNLWTYGLDIDYRIYAPLLVQKRACEWRHSSILSHHNDDFI